MNQNKACDSCARSKTRCAWSGEQICQRCCKLKLNCTLTPPGPRKRREKSTRVKALEQKVDGLMTLLTATQQASLSTTAAAPEQAQEREPSSVLPWVQGVSHVQSSLFYLGQTPPTQGNDTHDQYIDFVAGFRVSFSEADRILHEYRTDMLPNFPFVPIAHCSARDMYNEKPLLLKTIISSCRPQPKAVENAIDQWYREYFAYNIVVLNESSLELLQAILIYVAWRDINFFAHARDTSILQLALGLIGDLGLSRPPETQRIPPKSIIDEAVVTLRGLNLQTKRSLADQRALLGTFYVTSEARTFFRRAHPLEYTDYMEQCCEALLKAQEYPTDLLLVGVVRMQRLVLQTTFIFPEKSPNDSRAALTGSDALAIVTTRRDLEDIMSQIPEHLKTSHLLWSHHHAVLVRLYEPVIYMLFSTATNRIFTKSQALWDCLQGIKSVFEHLLEIPAETLSALSFAFLAHLSFANVTLSRLLLMKDPDWDAAVALKSVNIPRILQLLSDHLELSDHLSGPRRKILDDGKGLLLKLAEKMKWAKGWYDSRLPSDPLVSDAVMPRSTALYSTEEEGLFWQTMFDMSNSVVL